MVVYRLAQECLNNISRHSQAKSVNISVSTADKVLRLRVQDDGIGFDVEQCVGKNKCSGLVGMRERVILLGGSCDIRSTLSSGNMGTGRKNPGTEVDIQLPIPGNIPSASPWDVVR
jgi:signal transduction histidine kinase